MKTCLKAVWLVFLLCCSHVLCANNCTQALEQVQDLCNAQQYSQAISALNKVDCKNYVYYNLLLNAYMQTEKYAQVRQCAESYLRSETQPTQTTALAHYYNALALHKLNLFDEAYTAIVLAQNTWKNKQCTEYAMTINAKGTILEKLNKHNDAIAAYKEALKIYTTLPSSSHNNNLQLITLGNIAHVYLSLAQPDKAITYFKKAETIYHQDPESTLSNYLSIANNMGEYYSQKENFEQAVIYFQKVAETKRQKLGSNHSSYALSLLNVITALYNSQQYTNTIPYIQEYLHILRAMLQRNFTIMTEQERENYWNAQAQILDNLLVTATYACLSTKNGDASLIYNICLLSKSLLLDTTTQIDALLQSSNNAALNNMRHELFVTQQALVAQGDNSSAYTQKLAQKCDSLEAQLLQQMSQLQDQMKQLHITWQDIQTKLTKQDLAVEFVCLGQGESTEYAVILLRKQWKFPKIYYLNGLAETIAAQQISPLEMHNNAIFGKLVWQHVLQEANAEDHIYFVPAGQLQLMAAEYFTVNNNVRMTDRYHMHRLSSSKQLLAPTKSNKWQSVALLGGMDYNASIEEIEYYASQYQAPALQDTIANAQQPQTTIWLPLPGALREVQAIDQLLTQKGIKTFLATHDAATEAAMYAVTQQQYDIIHIATHGFYAPTDQASGLVMAGANTLQLQPNPQLGSGILTTNKIAKLPLRNTQLAVLSACQTGVGKVTTEGVFGIQRAFKRAGVQQLIVSLWEVNDAVTAALMTTFYKALLAGHNCYNAFVIATDIIQQTTFQLNGKEVSGNDIALYGAFVLID